MSSIEQVSEERAYVRNDLNAIFVSLELSLTSWLITSLSPGGGDKMSKHQVSGGDVAGLFARFSLPKNDVRRALEFDSKCLPIVCQFEFSAKKWRIITPLTYCVSGVLFGCGGWI